MSVSRERVVVAYGSRIEVIQIAHNKARKRFTAHRCDITAVKQVGSLGILAGSADGALLFWDQNYRRTKSPKSARLIRSLDVLSNGEGFVYATDQYASIHSPLWHSRPYTDHNFWTGRPWKVKALPHSHTFIVATAMPNPIKMFTFTPGEVRLESSDFIGHRASVYAVAATPSPHVFATGGYDGECRVWDTRVSTHSVALLEDSWVDDAIYSLSWDGFHIAAGMSRYGSVRTWDLRFPRSMWHSQSDVLHRWYLGYVESPVYDVHINYSAVWAVTDENTWLMNINDQVNTHDTTKNRNK